MTRLRIKTDISGASTFDRDTFCNYEYTGKSEPWCPQSPSTNSFTESRNFEAMQDVNNPNFKKDSSEGKIINQPMIKEKYDFICSPTVIAVDYDQDGYPKPTWHSGASFVDPLPTSYPFLLKTYPAEDVDNYLKDFESERNVAIAAAYANVDESEMLALASLAELPETIQFLMKVLQKFIGICKKFTKKKVTLAATRLATKMSLKEYAKARADIWMEMRYAVRPLIYDTIQVVAALNVKGKPPRHTARGFHRVEDSGTHDFDAWGDTSVLKLNVHSVWRRESNYRAGVLYEIDVEGFGILNVLGIDKPLASIYDLTMFSFVIDWFLNIGDLIAALEPSSNLSPLSSWIVEEHKFTTVKTHSEFDRVDRVVNTSTSDYDYGGSSHTHIITRRIPNPVMHVYPSVNINLDWLKIVDLSILARSIYRVFLSK
jgi:hypothetical protein